MVSEVTRLPRMGEGDDSLPAANDVMGMVFNIQRNSTEDGPGIRTTVFMKGCPMHCPWCHNPESIKMSPELVWYSVRCIGAQDCISNCPQDALTLNQDGIIIDRSRCDACGKCVIACPANAMEILGKRMTVEEVSEIVLRDRVFYEKSGGGMTLSGGEASLQPKFAVALMRVMQREGIHMALDTCGGTKWKVLEPLIDLADLILLDLKIMDEEKHLKVLGVSLDTVLKNAREIANKGKNLWVRTPVIPGYTDSEENIRRIAHFIKNHLPNTTRYDLLAFNNTCSTKYRRLGHVWSMEEESMVSEERMNILAGIAKEEGLDFVYWSGMTV